MGGSLHRILQILICYNITIFSQEKTLLQGGLED